MIPFKSCTPKTKKREAEEEENYSLQKEPTWLAAKVLQLNFDTWAAIFIFILFKKNKEKNNYKSTSILDTDATQLFFRSLLFLSLRTSR